MNTREKLKLMAEIEHRNNERIRKAISEVKKNEPVFHSCTAAHHSGDSGKTEEDQGVQKTE